MTSIKEIHVKRPVGYSLLRIDHKNRELVLVFFRRKWKEKKYV